ncbi:unnamed protein product, partial [Adineta steineri]
LPLGERLKRLLGLIKQKLIDLNLFQRVPPTQDENILRRQRYNTRLYVV